MTTMLEVETDDLVESSSVTDLKQIIDGLTLEVRAKMDRLKVLGLSDEGAMLVQDVHDLMVDAERRSRLALYDEPELERG